MKIVINHFLQNTGTIEYINGTLIIRVLWISRNISVLHQFSCIHGYLCTEYEYIKINSEQVSKLRYFFDKYTDYNTIGKNIKYLADFWLK